MAAILDNRSTLRLKKIGLNPTRTGLLEVLERAGASLRVVDESSRESVARKYGNEPFGELMMRMPPGGTLRVEREDVPLMIDEIPLVALIGAVRGGAEITGAEELRVKESDRLERTAEILRAFGAELELREDGMSVPGGQELTGAEVDTGDDHRMAMLGTAAALAAEGESVVRGLGGTTVSYGDFQDHLDWVFPGVEGISD